jgi:hypothetical protein
LGFLDAHRQATSTLLTQAIGRVTLDSPVTDLPVQYLRTKNVLINMATSGMTVAELLRMPRAELLDNRGLGPVTLADVEATLARFKWQLRPKGASASNRASASTNLMEALVLHGAISSLERRGFTRAQIVRLLLVEVVRLSHGDKVLLESLVASIKKYADDRAQQARNPQK